MFKNTYFFLVTMLLSALISCQSQTKVVVGANRTEVYLPLLKNKRVAVVANQTSVIFKNNHSGYTHVVDSLLRLKIKITKVFAPEHGFRGQAEAGALVKNNIDTKTGLPIISLYGKNKKLDPKQLDSIDVVVFDIQDVGVRFYTYISTLHYVMEACAEANKTLLVLDRPNPNAAYVDGPVLEPAFKSFVGMHPVPLVYGMTIGEYAQMINGEGWLPDGLHCNLKVVTLKNYTHQTIYELPIKPSPNLPNATSVNLYPSLALFEGTTVSCGRGTDWQFQIFGAPYLPKNIYNFSFTPEPNQGVTKPKHQGQLCFGLDLRNAKPLNKLNLNWIIDAYKNTPDKSKFFNSYFTLLAGTKTLEQQIKQGLDAKTITKTWQPALKAFKKIRAKYLLYK